MDEDDYENHDKNLFRKILAGDYEFDPPYWDDISQAGKASQIVGRRKMHVVRYKKSAIQILIVVSIHIQSQWVAIQ